ncbi:MAG TPA: transporter [Thermoanaerobaculia bacterium]
MSWRYQRSFRHFVGTEEQENRAEEGSQVINKIHQAEIGIRYNYNDRWSVSVGIPYLIAQRSTPIRDANRVVVDRYITHGTGVGDITVTARRLLWHPRDHPDGNISLGLGIKIPTGQYNETDTVTRIVNGQRVNSIETIDQSIQPGDGGFGAIIDLQVFQRIGQSGFALYGSGTYLINPSNTNGVRTYRTALGEEIMSVADQYLYRAGGSYANSSWKGFGVSLGGRMEGVPVYDLVGGSDGFRRPGYAISIEPAVSWSKGPHTVSLSVPFAVERNRQRSVPDRLVPGRHGDAAFADYLILLGYWRKF